MSPSYASTAVIAAGLLDTNETLASGVHHITWDGRDVHDRRIASRVYIVNLLQGAFATSAKVILIR